MADKAGTGQQVLALYGSKDDLEHLAGRIKRCVPGGSKLSNEEAIALAQISIATRFNPFIGEISYLPGVGPHIGILGLRNRAKGQSTYSLAFRAMNPQEIKEHDVRTEVGDVGRICELYHHDLLRSAAEINKLIGEPFIPIGPIVGLGIWRRPYKEIAQYKPDPVPHGKSPQWVADKRAEADALRKAFDVTILPFSDAVPEFAVANGDDVVEAEFVQREVAANAERRSAKVDADDLFGEQALDEIEPVPTAGVAAVPVEKTLPEPVVGPEETTDVEIPEEVVEMAGAGEKATMGPLELIRQYARAYGKRDADLAPTGGQLKLLGALCAILGESGLPSNSLFKLREVVWGEGSNFIRSQFQALLQFVCEMDNEGNIAKDSNGRFLLKEGVVEELMPLFEAEVPADAEPDLPF